MNKILTPIAVRNPTLAAILLALLGFSLFSIGDAALKALTSHYSPFTIAFYMAAFVVLTSTILAIASKNLRTLLTLPDRKWHILRGSCLALQFFLMVYAFSVMPLAEVYALLFAAPLITVLLSWGLLRERPGLPLLVLITTGFIGVLIILRPGLIPLHLAALGMVAAAAAFALSHVIVRFMRAPSQPLLSWPLYTELAVLFGALPFYAQNPQLPTFTHLALLFLIAQFSLSALALLGAALKIGRTNIVAPFQYVQMLWAIGLGYMIFGDIPDHWTLIGATLIIGSGLLIIRQESAPLRPTDLEHTI